MLNDTFGYVPDLPEEIRADFAELSQDVAALQATWDLYLGLFSDQENVALLSDLALASFQIIEESLVADMTMSICRLSDPSKSRGKANLSFKALVQCCCDIPDTNTLLSSFQDACQPVRKWRNKRVAHNDLAVRINPHDNPLPDIPKSLIDKILQLAGDILNLILGRFADVELSFSPRVQGGSDALINCLKIAYGSQKRE